MHWYLELSINFSIEIERSNAERLLENVAVIAGFTNSNKEPSSMAINPRMSKLKDINVYLDLKILVTT